MKKHGKIDIFLGFSMLFYRYFLRLPQSLSDKYTIINFNTGNSFNWFNVPLPSGWYTGNTAVISIKIGHYITPVINNKIAFECIAADNNNYQIKVDDSAILNTNGHLVLMRIV